MPAEPDPPPETVPVLGYRLARIDLETAARSLRTEANRVAGSCLVVTLNPELVVRAHSDGELRDVLQGADLTVADGVGLLWAARRAGHPLPGRVPGVELVSRTMELAGEDLSVYFLGGREGVAERAARAAQANWGSVPAGWHHGYFGRDDEDRIVADIAASAPDLLLAGLGEGQEEFLARNRDRLGAKVMVGVGGTLDVLAGEAKRTPAWTRRLHLEWAWRVGLDRRRWHRFPRLLEFVRLVLREERGRRGSTNGSG